MYNNKEKIRYYSIYELSHAFKGLMNVRWFFFPLRALVWIISAILPYRSMISSAPTYSIFPIYFKTSFIVNCFILFGLGTLLYAVISTAKYFQFISKLKSAGTKLSNEDLTSASRYQVSRMWAYGISLFFTIILGFKALAAFSGYSNFVRANISTLTGQSIDYVTEYTNHIVQEMLTSGNVFMGIVIAACYIALGLTQVMTMFKLNSWALDQRMIFPSDRSYKKIVEGTNILKIACFIESVSGALGYILVNMGLKATADGLLSIYHSNTKTNTKTTNERKFLPNQSVTAKPHMAKADLLRFCSECGSEINPLYKGKFCWQCGYLMNPDAK